MPNIVMMEPQQPKYREKVLIGLENAPPSFDVRSKVTGPGGANLHYITNETGAIVTIRGKGSGFLEPSGHESIEPLHICVEHSKYEVLQAGRQLAFNLIETVQQEWSHIQQQQQTQPSQQQQSESQQQTVQQHVQTIPIHSQVVAGATGGNTANVPTNSASAADLIPTTGALQLQLPIYTPPPSLAVPPPPIHLAQPPIQVNVGSTSSTSQAGQTQGGGTGPVTSDTSNTAIVQAQPSPGEMQQQIQIQPQQQLFVSQGGGVIQPATIIPQQQLQPAPSILTHQPQIITQASYPIQYVQASNGQMVLAYPNIMRPVTTDAAGAQHPQVMLVQYTPQRPLVQGRTTTQSHTIPQIVQIVNPQTGQVQHVIQHIQPQIQMQQLALTAGGQVGTTGVVAAGGQVLMPLAQATQHGPQSGQQTQQPQVVQSGQSIQFTTGPTSHPISQGMIITSHPHQQQVTVSQGSLSQQERTPQIVQQQTVMNQVRPAQGVKRRYDSGPTNSLPPNYQTIPPPQNMLPPAMTIQNIRKGIGSDAGLQQVLRQQVQAQSQQSAAQQQQHHQTLQQQQIQQLQQAQLQQAQLQVQQQLQHQATTHLVQQQSSTQADDGQHIDDKSQQQQTVSPASWFLLQNVIGKTTSLSSTNSFFIDEWRLHSGQRPSFYIQTQAPPSPSTNNDTMKSDQPKRGRAAVSTAETTSGGGKENINKPLTGAGFGLQQYQQNKQTPPGSQQQASSQQVYSGTQPESFSSYPPPQPTYPPIYQQPPPASYQPYNSWVMPQ